MTAMATPRHRVTAATVQMRSVADSVADASVWSLDADEAHTTLVELTRLEAQVAALKLRVAAHAESVDTRDATAAWAHATRQTPRAAKSQVKLAQALEAHPHTADALAVGDLNLEQARVVVHAVDELPDTVGPELTARAEEHLVGLAADHHAGALRILGRRLLEVVAPDLVDAHEAALLEREEADALAACRLRARFDDHGRLVGSFVLPHLHGAMFLKAVTAFAAPKHRAATDGAEVAKQTAGRPTPERLGRAFCELLERLPATSLPKTGGTNATVVVTLSYETLVGQLETAGVILDTGHRISAGEARRLACQAAIIPAVLGTRSEVLDLGHQTRLFTAAQHLALALRDKGCTEPGCDAPPWRCHAHHDLEWSNGGPTDLANGRLLCPRHHHLHHRHQPTKPGYHPRT